MSAEAQRLAELTAAEFHREVGRVAGRLRALADKVETAASQSTPSSAAAQIINEIVWGLANAHLDGLVRHADDAEKALKEAAR